MVLMHMNVLCIRRAVHCRVTNKQRPKNSAFGIWSWSSAAAKSTS